MSERELPPATAPRSLQAGAATPNLPSAVPAASPVSTPLTAPLLAPAPAHAVQDLLFGSFTPEILAGSAEQALCRRTCSVQRPATASPSMASAPRAEHASSSSHHAGPAVSADLSADRAACTVQLPPPPPLRPGDRPQTVASLEARSLPFQAQVSHRGARLRSIIVAPNQSAGELRRWIPQDPQEDWQLVRPKFWWRKVNPSFPRALHADPRQRTSRGALASESDPFKGRCFRCLSAQHFVRDCKDAVHCLDCKKPGHRARDCPSKRSSAAAAAPQPPPPARTGSTTASKRCGHAVPKEAAWVGARAWAPV
jgi:hypothetical protein